MKKEIYNVGDILYAILEEKHIVVPVKVVEQITIKNLEGESINYKVLLPNNKNQQVKINKSLKVYKDLDELNNYMVENAKKSIDNMLENALELEEKYFNLKESLIEKNDTCKLEENKVIIDNKSIKIDLGDGQLANISEIDLKQLDIEK